MSATGSGADTRLALLFFESPRSHGLSSVFSCVLRVIICLLMMALVGG